MTDLDALTRGAEEILPEGRLREQLDEGRALRVKLGIDPTTPDIHLGHTVVLNKLRQFQDEGHLVVLIIGDLTARVGDPSGRDTRRPVLGPEEIAANARTYQDQAFKVLDRERTEVRFNSQWLEMPPEGLFDLVGKTTVARLLERDDFKRRMAADQPISALELLYPLLQGYDSVVVDADVELGGTDQKFNLLFARDIQAAYGKPAQSIITVPLLVGTDGVEKMSKSAGNYVGVTDQPEEMFGKLMSIPDAVMGSYYELLLGEPEPGGHPAEAKRSLARRIIERFHDASAAEAAEAQFDRLHVDREAPEDVPEVTLAGIDALGADPENGQIHLPLLISSVFEVSTSEARRLLQQGGVKVEGETIAAEPLDLPADQLLGKVIQVGKRRFARLV
jgi:tyrosyl-tRNA synthetase